MFWRTRYLVRKYLPSTRCAHPAFITRVAAKGCQGCVWSQYHNPGLPPTVLWVLVTASLEWAPWFQFPPCLPLPKPLYQRVPGQSFPSRLFALKSLCVCTALQKHDPRQASAICYCYLPASTARRRHPSQITVPDGTSQTESISTLHTTYFT